MKTTCNLAAILAAILGFAGPASALTLTNNPSIATTGGKIPGAGGEILNVQTNDNRTFWWADASGTGWMNAASANLNMAGYTLKRITDTNGITLNLYNGTANGSVTNGGTITTSWGAGSHGNWINSITITNAALVQVSVIDTHNTTAYYDAGKVLLANVGDVAVTSLVCGLGSDGPTWGIFIQQSGNLTVGTITNQTDTASSRTGGPINLTGGGPGAGNCSIGAIVQNSTENSDVTIQNYKSVTVGGNGIDARDVSTRADITHYAGNVFIQNIGAGGIAVSGNIQAGPITNNSTTGGTPTGVVITNIAGNVQVGNINTHSGDWGITGANKDGAGSVIISNVTGNVRVGNLSTYFGTTNGTYLFNAGNITIVSAGSVSVGNLDTRQAASNSASYAGNVTLTAGGNLSVTGSVITLFAAYGGTRRGVLALATSPGSGGSIYVNSQTTDVFDVSLMQSAQFSSDSGNSYLAGVLTNFTMGATSGSGSLASPYVTTQTVLRVAAGQTLYYNYTVGGLNASLGGSVYQVASLAGTAGAGGVLVGLQIGAPVIANVGASNITATTADLIGSLATGAAPVTVTCYWGPSDGGTVAGAWAHADTRGTQVPGLVTNSVAGLTAGQAYYFRYYATNGQGGAWAPSTKPFSTAGTPAINNASGASSIGATSATLNGNLTSGSPDPSIWIYWGTTDGSTNKGNWSQVSYVGQLGVGAFSSPLSGLLANQQYWYGCYASNVNGDAWASASTNFTTTVPTLTVTPASNVVVNGALATTGTVAYTVSISATSAVSVSVNYATSNGTATANTDYVPASGTLTIPAGSVSSTISVQIIGANAYKPAVTFYVNWSNATSAAIGTPQVSCTINSTNTTFFVRGDGTGNDSAHGGSSWSDAFATLQHALTNVPYNTPFTINVQASTGGQSYATCSQTPAYVVVTYPLEGLNIAFQGGWTTVDNAPAQTGMSWIMDAATNNPGIRLSGSAHNQPLWLTVNNFAFSNVTMGVACSNGATANQSGIVLAVNNCTIYAQNHGVFAYWPKGYATTYAGVGGPTLVAATNVNIVAGLGGAGDGVHVEGSWMGSGITSSGNDPATGKPRVSTIRSVPGNGVYMTCPNNGQMCNAMFSNTVIYGCAGNGVHLDVARTGNSGSTPYNVQATLRNCTIVDNGTNGLDMLSQTANTNSWASITNCIFAGNAGSAVSLSSTNSAFLCNENYNVFYGNGLLVNVAAQSPAANTSTADPLLYAHGAKPSPWYLIGSTRSPAYRQGSDGLNRGAYQDIKLSSGSAVFLR